MKAFSIQQPWASLVVSGLKDVENRKWALKSLPLRVLIHAGARRQPITDDNMPYPYYWHIENYQKMGILPPLEKTPVSSIVGVATITACQVNNDSLWAMRGPGAEYQWVMTDTKIFKNPIPNVKGMLGIFDVPQINEKALPECMGVQLPHREGKTLFIPLNDRLYNEIINGERDELTWNVVDDNLLVFADHFLKALPTDTLVITNNGDSTRLNLAHYSVYKVTDDKGNPIVEEDDLGRKYDWVEARMIIE